MASYTENNVDNKVTTNSYFLIIGHLKRITMFAGLLTILFNLTNCNPAIDVVIPENESITISSPRTTALIDSNSTLKSVAPYPIGVATGAKLIAQNRKAADILASQFNSKTVYTYMSTEPIQGTFSLGEADYWVKYAQNHNIRLHGHCLVYHAGAPTWLTQFKGTTVEFEQAIKKHIYTIVGRYKGKIKSWDVINEITSYNSGAIAQTPFRKMYTDDKSYLDFVKRCFQWAHESDPDALLFYNDALYETLPSKVDRIVAMVEDFKRTGIPLDGLGTQMHIDINTSNAGIQSSFSRLASTGLLIHVSELDISLNPKKYNDFAITNDLKQVQAAKFQLVAELYRQLIAPSQQFGITLWDLSDADSWLVVQKGRVEAPCIFDSNYNKKPAYYALLRGLVN